MTQEIYQIGDEFDQLKGRAMEKSQNVEQEHLSVI